MKTLLLILMFVATIPAFAMTRFETVCKDHDCFKNGWVTTAADYSLDTICKNNDCTRFGWFSVANDNSTYDVTCNAGSCFTKGWHSSQQIEDKTYIDDVTCKSGKCLSAGWSVKTGYDLMGGDVTCFYADCSRFGGTSFWRGHPAYTACYNQDCYHNGWDWLLY